MKKKILNILLIAFACSALMPAGAVQAQPVGQISRFNRFKSWIMAQKQIASNDIQALWIYGVKKAKGQPIGKDEEQAAWVASKKAGIALAVIVTFITTVFGVRYVTKWWEGRKQKMQARPESSLEEEAVEKILVATTKARKGGYYPDHAKEVVLKYIDENKPDLNNIKIDGKDFFEYAMEIEDGYLVEELLLDPDFGYDLKVDQFKGFIVKNDLDWQKMLKNYAFKRGNDFIAEAIKNGASIFHQAIAKEYSTLINFVKKNVPNINELKIDGKDIFMYVLDSNDRGSQAWLDFLLSPSSKFNLTLDHFSAASSRYSWQVLLKYGAMRGDQFLQKAIQNGADIDAVVYKMENQMVPLLAGFANNGRLDAVNLLLQKGAQVDMRDSIGRTPLSYAAKNLQEQIVKLLIEYGADPTIKDNESKDAFDYLKESGIWDETDVDKKARIYNLLLGAKDLESKKLSGQDPAAFMEFLTGHFKAPQSYQSKLPTEIVKEIYRHLKAPEPLANPSRFKEIKELMEQEQQ